jgi:hypothetical protein
MKSTTKLNYYYVPKKQRYKLTNIKSVEPVEPIDIELELYLLLHIDIWDNKGQQDDTMVLNLF